MHDLRHHYGNSSRPPLAAYTAKIRRRKKRSYRGLPNWPKFIAKAKRGRAYCLRVASPLGCVLLGRSPDGEAEGDLVDEIREIVHQVQGVVVHTAHQVPEEVAEGVDRPSDSDDETHGAECPC